MATKLFLGYKLRRLREQKALSQAALAALLEVSPSYLNQIENNQRPLTVPVLLRIAQAFDIELASLVDDDDARLVADLREAVGDPAFGGGGPVGLAELRNVAAASPELAKRMLSLYQSYRHLQERFQALADSLPAGGDAEAQTQPKFPYEAVRDFFYYCNNYFGPLDEAAERLHAEAGLRHGAIEAGLADYLRRRHDVRVHMAEEDDPKVMRSFDAVGRTLALSALLAGPSRSFHLAHQVALLEYRDLIEDIVATARLPGEDARAICRVGLANYFAGALVMPYGAFAAQARLVRHDVELLQSRFGASFEQVCHRLSTLQRPGARGVPFYFVRVDMAGNITKRHSATRFHFTRFGGACPLWNVHAAFAQPERILVQQARMPDGVSYICIARTVTKPGGAYLRPDRRFAVGLGCEAAHAAEVVYAAGLDLASDQAAVPIGVNCRVCERADCQQRAFPPIGSPITVDENNRRFVPYLFG
jgi:predicted transcriptional regulator/transcriptional regulator with XRE-family HTH domain